MKSKKTKKGSDSVTAADLREAVEELALMTARAVDSVIKESGKEFQAVRQETKKEFQAVRQEMKQEFQVVRQGMKDFEQRLEGRFDEMHRHFDVAVENIEDEMKLANREEIELMKDKQDDHEQRITALERTR